MYSKIIVGYDGEKESRDALAMAAMLARAGGGELLLACTIRADFPIAPGTDRFFTAQEDAADQLLEDGAASLPDGLVAETRMILGSSPAQALHDLAEVESADLLAVGSTRRGAAGRVLAGSTAERLLHGAPCAIAVAPRGYAEQAVDTPRVIAVGFNMLPESRRALAYAKELAEASSATLRLVAVQEEDLLFGYPDLPGEGGARVEIAIYDRKRLEEALGEAVDALPASLHAQGQVITGRPSEVLADEAAKGADLLVVGSRGYGPIRRVLMGGTSAKLMRSSPCPVLVVPRSVELGGAAGRDASAPASA